MEANATAKQDGDEVLAARYLTATSSVEEPLSVQPAVRGGPRGVCGQRNVHTPVQVWRWRSTERPHVAQNATRP